MSKIELESEGVFCPQCGSMMKQFGPKSRKQYRCLEDPEHYATDNKIKTMRKVVLE
jgi:DNA-directed RNA polymerase subunit M/transcription elongation factor TFIIS